MCIRDRVRPLVRFGEILALCSYRGFPTFVSFLLQQNSVHASLCLLYTSDAAVVLMSRQLRVLCESSLRAFAAFFNSFDATGSSRLSVFQLQLLLNKVTDDSSRDQKNIPRDIVRLDPSLAELNIQADVAIDCLIASMRGLPQPGATGRTSESPRPPKLHICGVAHDDELVSQTRACVHKALSHHFQGLLKLVARFDSFRSLLDGTVEA